MKRLIIVFLLVFLNFICCYSQSFIPQGVASYYGKQFNGRKTANGERFNMNSFTSAHRTLPFNSLVRVTNLKNGKSTIVRVNDRGPAKKTRIIDLSLAAAKEIDLVSSGLSKVKIELVDPKEIELYKNKSKLYRDFCYAEVEPFEPLSAFNLNGIRPLSDGGSIPGKQHSCVFSLEYVADTLSKIKISPIFNSSATASVSSSKSRRK